MNTTIKAIIGVAVIASFVMVTPSTSQALSCIDAEGMIKHIVEQPDYIVVTATPTDQAEYVKDKATQEGMYDSGYTGQFIEVSKVHKGTAPEQQWVYFERNDTWNYLCAGAPPKVGSEQLYVINVSSNVFSLPTIVAVYEADSEIAKDTIEAIEDGEAVVEPMIYDVSKSDWVQQLHDELKDMALIVKVKLAEWKFWMAK